MFADPLPGLAARYGRRTDLARKLLGPVGVALRGRAGPRLAGGLGLLMTSLGSSLAEFSVLCTIDFVLTVASYAQVLARFGHALSDPTRCRLLLVLRDGPAYPADLPDALGVSRTNLSNHLACLRGCGLVVAVPEGRRSRYELADRRLGHALADLIELALAIDPDAACPVDAKGSCR